MALEAERINVSVHSQLTFSKPLVQSDTEFEDEMLEFVRVLQENVGGLVQGWIDTLVEVHPSLLCDVDVSVVSDSV